MKDHLETAFHLSKVTEFAEKSKKEEIRTGKNRQVGMRIARICYSLYKEGGSKRSFEVEVLKRIQDGLDMGDINHSKNFPEKFRPFLANEIHNRMTTFLKIRYSQTGFLPPLNIGADKGTSNHRTRQFLTAVTIVPDSEKLFQIVYLGQPVVKDHTGYGVAKSIKDGLDSFGIIGKQIEGSSHDGQYFHLSITFFCICIFFFGCIFCYHFVYFASLDDKI